MRVDGVRVLCKYGICDDDARFGVEEETPVVVLPYQETRDLGTPWIALTVHDSYALQSTVDRVSTPFVRRVCWCLAGLTVC